VNILIHRALIYASADEFLAGAVPFLTKGLERGETVLAVTSDSNAALLRDHFDSEHLTFLSAAAWYDAPGRALAAVHRYVDRSASLRLIGEPIWTGLDSLETAEWGRYESVLNFSLADTPASLLCGYDSRVVPAAIVADARRTHPELTVGHDSQPSGRYADPVDYCAELDEPLPGQPDTGVAELSNFFELVTVRAFVAAHARALGLPAGRLDDFVVAVNEVATNAIRDGGGYGGLRLWSTDRRVVGEVTDDGQGHETLLGFRRPDPHGERGHGLWITRQLVDLLEIRINQPGTTVRLHIRRDGH
jgi:anti-sigma regulatory factor (Ser/Thr protein kinase)